jgi:hypothetical protein
MSEANLPDLHELVGVHRRPASAAAASASPAHKPSSHDAAGLGAEAPSWPPVDGAVTDARSTGIDRPTLERMQENYRYEFLLRNTVLFVLFFMDNPNL